MKVKTSELTGAALDWAVAAAIGYSPWLQTSEEIINALNLNPDDPEDEKEIAVYKARPPRIWIGLKGSRCSCPKYHSDWSQGGPIIEWEGILVGPSPFPAQADSKFAAGLGCDWDTCTHIVTGPTSLIAAMRCYVASQLGDSVDIPEELK
jgi:hypothetical protein